MAREAVPRRALEHGVHVARFAGLQPVRPGELVPGGDVVELRARALRERAVADEREQTKRWRADGAILMSRWPYCSRAPLNVDVPWQRWHCATVLPEVHVVPCVAGAAVAAQLHDLRRLPVTARAGGPLVRAGEDETRDLSVVEPPEAPAVRRVAGLAVLAERALVAVARW